MFKLYISAGKGHIWKLHSYSLHLYECVLFCVLLWEWYNKKIVTFKYRDIILKKYTLITFHRKWVTD